MQTAIAENSRMALNQSEYEERYSELTERYNTIKADYDKISEQIESKSLRENYSRASSGHWKSRGL